LKTEAEDVEVELLTDRFKLMMHDLNELPL